LNCYADVFSAFELPALPAHTPSPSEFIAAAVRGLRLSKLKEKWSAWKKVYDTVCASLKEK
jgi:hypothetical protein